MKFDPTLFESRQHAVLRIVADFYKTRPSEIVSARRFKRIFRIRSMAILITRRLPPRANARPLSLSTIGALYHRDHTTALYSSRIAAKLLVEDARFASDYAALTRLVEADAARKATLRIDPPTVKIIYPGRTARGQFARRVCQEGATVHE